MIQPVLVLNCGSSSIKFGLFDASINPLPRQPFWQGQITAISSGQAQWHASNGELLSLPLDNAEPYHAALATILQRAEAQLMGNKLVAVGHRVVHGGSRYIAPTLINQGVLADLRDFIPLAPLHQPFALDAIEILLMSHPETPQVACFDTAFHHCLPDVEKMLALPYSAWERGLRRYGFHGLSYGYMAVVLAERYGERACGKTIVAHLGSGASLCAMQNLQSVATTMGFSALDGLMMGTRCGALDPGAVIYLMEIEKLSLAQVAHTLYHESGLLGVSGRSADPRVLLALEQGEDPVAKQARAALGLYVRRIIREIGALVAVLGGLDMLVFTAGIGEHNATLRQRIVQGLGFLGATLNDEANQAHASQISSADSRVVVAIEPTNEEWLCAQQTIACQSAPHA